MKRRKKSEARRGATRAREPEAHTRSTPVVQTLSRKKQWAFRILAVVVVPLVLIGALEAALRLSGYGYPTSFFLKRNREGHPVLVENDKFGWRFFPRAVARSPSPLLLKAKKTPGAYRIFLFGESAALGDPKPAYGVGRYLEALLRERFPGAEVEVVCVAMVAVNSHAILPIARDCAGYGGDLWIIYMGHNEMQGAFGANFTLGPERSRLAMIRTTLALRAMKLGQLVEEVVHWAQGNSGTAASWEGMKMYLKQQLPPDDSRKAGVYRHFRRNLEDILRTASRAGAQTVVSTVASNLKDCPPFTSLHRLTLADHERARWETLYQRGADLQASHQTREAYSLFKEAAQIDRQFAELPFRAGQCEWQLTNYPTAATSFAQARDWDALPFRTDGTLNSITREVAAQFSGRGAHLLDAEAELGRQSLEGIAGEEMFFDHVHLNFDGNYRLARLFASQVEKLLPPTIIRQRTGEWASAEGCERRLGLTDWNRNPVYESMFQRLSDAPFTNQLNHVSRRQRLVEKIIQNRDRMHPRLFLETRGVYEDAMAKNPGDFRLMENFAEFLEAAGDLEEAAGQWQRVIALLPQHYAAHFQLGRVLSRQKKYPAAKEHLAHALKLRPDLVEARIELGHALFSEGKPGEAMTEYLEARRRRPQEARVLVQMANALAAQEKRAEATARLQEAVQLRPGYWEARYLLGVELALNNELSAAIAQFREVIRLRSDHVLSHFNLAVALAKEGRIPEAASEFQETLRLEPNHELARQYLENIQPLLRGRQ